MSTESMRVTIPLTILTMVVMIIIGVIGWIINDKLFQISSSLWELNEKFEKLSDVRYNHETRIQLLEKEVGLIDKKIK